MCGCGRNSSFRFSCCSSVSDPLKVPKQSLARGGQQRPRHYVECDCRKLKVNTQQLNTIAGFRFSSERTSSAECSGTQRSFVPVTLCFQAGEARFTTLTRLVSLDCCTQIGRAPRAMLRQVLAASHRRRTAPKVSHSATICKPEFKTTQSSLQLITVARSLNEFVTPASSNTAKYPETSHLRMLIACEDINKLLGR